MIDNISFQEGLNFKHKPQVSVENPLLLPFGLPVAHSKSSKQQKYDKGL